MCSCSVQCLLRFYHQRQQWSTFITFDHLNVMDRSCWVLCSINSIIGCDNGTHSCIELLVSLKLGSVNNGNNIQCDLLRQLYYFRYIYYTNNIVESHNCDNGAIVALNFQNSQFPENQLFFISWLLWTYLLFVILLIGLYHRLQ